LKQVYAPGGELLGSILRLPGFRRRAGTRQRGGDVAGGAAGAVRVDEPKRVWFRGEWRMPRRSVEAYSSAADARAIAATRLALAYDPGRLGRGVCADTSAFVGRWGAQICRGTARWRPWMATTLAGQADVVRSRARRQCSCPREPSACTQRWLNAVVCDRLNGALIEFSIATNPISDLRRCRRQIDGRRAWCGTGPTSPARRSGWCLQVACLGKRAERAHYLGVCARRSSRVRSAGSKRHGRPAYGSRPSAGSAIVRRDRSPVTAHGGCGDRALLARRRRSPGCGDCRFAELGDAIVDHTARFCLVQFPEAIYRRPLSKTAEQSTAIVGELLGPRQRPGAAARAGDGRAR